LELEERYQLSKASSVHLCGRSSDDLRDEVARYKQLTLDKPVRIIGLGDTLFPGRLEAFLSSPPAAIFAYGNLGALTGETFAAFASRNATRNDLDRVEKAVERRVLESKVLVTGANTPVYQRAAVVPLRWGAPRVLVLDRGLFEAMGESLDQEPFRAARLWRYRFDPATDLVLTAHRPDDAYSPGANVRRDEVVAALADEIVAISVTPGGNSDRLTKLALERGRTVSAE
jgi:DNA processing protein